MGGGEVLVWEWGEGAGWALADEGARWALADMGARWALADEGVGWALGQALVDEDAGCALADGGGRGGRKGEDGAHVDEGSMVEGERRSLVRGRHGRHRQSMPGKRWSVEECKSESATWWADEPRVLPPIGARSGT